MYWYFRRKFFFMYDILVCTLCSIFYDVPNQKNIQFANILVGETTLMIYKLFFIVRYLLIIPTFLLGKTKIELPRGSRYF